MATIDLTQVHLNIKQIRELRNWSQDYIADSLSISTRAYSKIESGETQLSLNRLNEISKILELDPIQIIQFDSTRLLNEVQTEAIVPTKLVEQYEKTISILEDQVKLLKSLLN